MNTPTITECRTTDVEFVAVIEGQDVKLTTVRETLFEQGKVMLPPPWADRCPTISLFTNWQDEDSNLMPVDGCIHDPWTAGLMKAWVNDELANGTHRRK